MGSEYAPQNVFRTHRNREFVYVKNIVLRDAVTILFITGFMFLAEEGISS